MYTRSLLIKDTTKEERENIIRMSLDCGGGRGKDPELAYRDYIEGNRSFEEVSEYFR